MVRREGHAPPLETVSQSRNWRCRTMSMSAASAGNALVMQIKPATNSRPTIAKTKRCAEARKNINEACYDGGDEGHKEALCQTRAAITECVNIMVSENKKCITAKCEPPECNDQEGD
ncbi:MAG: hypothetical protein DIZ77_12615 [endosymbiont of Seepiophila jonesi]|uniref:Novel toxin 16 domain-containing protein n=1 Tax=endosymbiont of Lamellibrachia luymesi TaxID=2200907 RepID=A0A370E196_9GAMM|nr:MAG: hypothetical protein DIZ77_12615 [endosymbiont of Seepiophila jonesi]RDH92290.1 MAG: hypothetical protein DIZ79_03815 [endosymbiont of Lamellibrachia luymesi]